MLIFYIAETGMPVSIMTTYPYSMVEQVRSGEIPLPDGQSCIHLDSAEAIDFDEIEIVDGQFRRRVGMMMNAPTTCTVGEEIVIGGVPEGAEISLNGEVVGQMDGSGALEFKAETAGSYRFTFQRSGYIRKEITIEAHP